MHPGLRTLLRLIRGPRKWLYKKWRPVERWFQDRAIPYWHARTITLWMSVDETGSFQNDGSAFFVGATGVVLDKAGRKELDAIYAEFRASVLGGAGIGVEVHAVEWVHNASFVPGDLTARERIDLLRQFMSACTKCRGIRVINVLADSSTPRTFPNGTPLVGTKLESHLRKLVFSKLYEEFERLLDVGPHKGHVLIDENKIGAVVKLANAMSDRIPRQPISPIPVSSVTSPAVQAADVIAYFMLQQVQPNGPVKSAGATDAINDVATVCPDPNNPDVALVYFV